jgi:hypothetical protein
VLGSDSLTSPDIVVRAISNRIIHEKFTAQYSLQNEVDVAIMELDRPVPLSDRISTIPLASKEDQRSLEEPGRAPSTHPRPATPDSHTLRYHRHLLQENITPPPPCSAHTCIHPTRAHAPACGGEALCVLPAAGLPSVRASWCRPGRDSSKASGRRQEPVCYGAPRTAWSAIAL